MSERDPFELLKAINPVPALNEIRGSDSQLLADIITSPVPARSKRRRWWWIGSSVLLVGAGATAYALMRSEPAKDPTSVVCYSEAARPPAIQSVLPAQMDPVAACGQLWAKGEFGLGDVPRLTACVTDTNIVAVIPGEEHVCEQLGYTLWNGVIDEDAQTVIAFQDEINQTLGRTCYPRDAGIEIAVEIMARYGLTGWTTALIENWGDDRPCTVASVDPVAKTVTISGRRKHPNDKDPQE